MNWPFFKISLSSLYFIFTPILSAQEDALVADSGFAAPALENCNTDLRYLNQVVGWQARWPAQWKQVVRSGAQVSADSLSLWHGASQAILTTMGKLESSIGTSSMAPQPVVLRIQQQINELSTALSDTSSGYIFENPSTENAKAWNMLVLSDIQSAVSRFKQFLSNQYLPVAPISPALSDIENGTACFQIATKHWTTLDMTTDEFERIGHRLLEEKKAELLLTDEVGEGISKILERLRAFSQINDTTRTQLIEISEKAIERATKAAPLAFNQSPSHGIDVAELPLYRQAGSPAGYYLARQGLGSGQYLINPSRPNERRLMAEVIAFHEALPGHHLWSAYPRKNESVGHNSGILEGWAIYAETLSDELGLYSTTLDRQGMITKHLWAASRLVVEPGLHIHGWSRERAIQFMLTNTVLSRTEIEIEVDRYIAMPGQSLSYMLGANLIHVERELAKKLLDEDFNLKLFHDIVVVPGVRPLPELRADIRDWARNAKVNHH
ncbi:MAG: hypothetical protein ACI9QV_000891 [Methylophagaceae bacterium]